VTSYVTVCDVTRGACPIAYRSTFPSHFSCLSTNDQKMWTWTGPLLDALVVCDVSYNVYCYCNVHMWRHTSCRTILLGRCRHCTLVAPKTNL